MLRVLRAALVLATVFALVPVGALPVYAQDVPSDHVHAAMTGHWVGTLEYQDYSKPNSRVTLPTILDIAERPKGGVSIRFTYDDGPGKTVTGEDYFVLSADQSNVDWTGLKETEPEIFKVMSFDANDAIRVLTLVMQREGDDNNAPATIRESMTLTEGELTLLKEYRPKGSDFLFRHVFKLKRQ
jgi:hypothetical protein